MNHSEQATEMVMDFEGFEDHAYRDQRGILTIGFGHTQGVKEGDTCTRTQAEVWLDCDLQNADDVLAKHVKRPLNQNQWDALVSFVYNVGAGNFISSRMLKLLNQGDYKGAAGEFPKWVHTNGQINPGLVRRRAAERALFET